MTNDNTSILSFLADRQRFTNGTEDIATEVLGYILSKSVACREALREVVRVGDADVGPLALVKTQDTGDLGERPDLAGLDSRGHRRVLIEAKFWAGLTENQPNTYLDRLPNDGKPAVLLFVAPEARLETLWPEVLRRADGKVIPEDTRAEDIRSASVDGNEHRLMLTSWRALLDSMSYRAGADGDSSAERDILQLEGLCEREDMNAFLPLRSEQLGLEFARLMPHLVRLVQQAASHGKSEGFIVQDRLRFSSTGEGHGYWLHFAGTHAWFGIGYEVWAFLRETPLWLVVWDESGYMNFATVRSRLQPLLDDGRAIDNGACIQVPIHLRIGVEYESVLAGIMESLREVAKLISPPRGRPQGRPRNRP